MDCFPLNMLYCLSCFIFYQKRIDFTSVALSRLPMAYQRGQTSRFDWNGNRDCNGNLYCCNATVAVNSFCKPDYHATSEYKHILDANNVQSIHVII